MVATKPYDVLKGTVPTEKDRPSLKKCAKEKQTDVAGVPSSSQTESASASSQSQSTPESVSVGSLHSTHISQSAQEGRKNIYIYFLNFELVKCERFGSLNVCLFFKCVYRLNHVG